MTAATVERPAELYHYTGLEHVGPIQLVGISQGAIYLPIREKLYPGWIWLTDDADWRQGWATRETIHCDRSEARFRVGIPQEHLGRRLFRWHDVARNLGLPDTYVRHFDDAGGGGGEHWWLYHGTIHPDWLAGLARRPEALAASTPGGRGRAGR